MRATDKVERYAAKIDAKLRADEQATDKMQVRTTSSVRRVLLDCGYKRRGPRNVALIQDALIRHNVFPDPPLTTPGLDWDQPVWFTRTPPARVHHPGGVAFLNERDLETFLVANFDRLFDGLTFIARQFVIQHGKIDILARDRDGYVVIELKLSAPSDDLVFAVDRYMDDVAAWVSKKGGTERVRGLVVVGQANTAMREQLDQLAAADGRQIDWMEYRVELELRAS